LLGGAGVLGVGGGFSPTLVDFVKKKKNRPVNISPAERRSARRPPICVVSITLPRSPVSLSSGDEVPHIFTRKSRLQPGGIVITSAKRLLQQYRHEADVSRPALACALSGRSGHA